MILHVTTPEAWKSACRVEALHPPSLNDPGFVHGCTPAQLPGVLERFFGEADELVVLLVDPDRLDADVRWEAADGERFPHVYGPIPIRAVITTRPIRRGDDGVFTLPRWPPDGETLARLFHQSYGLLAPRYGLQVLPDQQVPFDALPESMRSLLARACEILRNAVLEDT